MSRSNHPYRPQGYIPTDVDRSSRIWKPTEDNLERVYHQIESANSFKFSVNGVVNEEKTIEQRRAAMDSLPRIIGAKYEMESGKIKIKIKQGDKHVEWTPDMIKKRHEEIDESDRILGASTEYDPQSSQLKVGLGGLESAV